MEKETKENRRDKIEENARYLASELCSKRLNCKDALITAVLFVDLACHDVAKSADESFKDVINLVVEGLAAICYLEEVEDNNG